MNGGQAVGHTIERGPDYRNIPTKFGLISLISFRGEDLNMKVYDVWQEKKACSAKYWLQHIVRTSFCSNESRGDVL